MLKVLGKRTVIQKKILIHFSVWYILIEGPDIWNVHCEALQDLADVVDVI